MNKQEVVIEVLTVERCSHARGAVDLVTSVVEPFENVTVHQVEVDCEDATDRKGFLGAPSIRVNGRDVEIWGTSRDDGCCRVYDPSNAFLHAWMIEAAVLRELQPAGVLFLCVANSARSQIAEGLARAMAPEHVTVWSAGSKPTRVRPEAIAVLREIGIDISAHRSKAVEEIPSADVDTVITLCGEEECPVFLGSATRIHWGLPDPADVKEPNARLDAFRQTRDELRRRLSILFDG